MYFGYASKAPWCSGQAYRTLDPSTAVQICPGLSAMITIVGRERKKIQIKEDITVAELSARYGLRLSAYTTLKNGRPVTSDEKLTPQDEVTFLEVFSGG